MWLPTCTPRYSSRASVSTAAVPNGGLNIHNEPVYWSLCDGRVVNWTLLELKEKRADELLESNSHEAYREVAKEFGLVVERTRVRAGRSGNAGALWCGR